MDEGRRPTGVKRSKISSLLDSMEKRGILGKVVRACRLPPNLRSVRTVAPQSRQDENAWDWLSPDDRKVIVVSVLLMILLCWVVLAPNDWTLRPNASAQITAVQPITGTLGQEIGVSEYESAHSALILDEDPFVGSPAWCENALAKYRFVNATEQGLHLELSGDGGYSAYTEYWRILNLPVKDYSNITFSTGIRVLSGQVDCTVRVVFTESPDAYHIYGETEDYPFVVYADQNTTPVAAGEDAELSLHIALDSLDYLADRYSGWLVQSWFYIRFSTVESATIVIKSAQVRVASPVPLCPIEIDLESANGSSLFGNEFTKWAHAYPILNLTRGNGSEGYSVVRPSRSFDLIYARTGVYLGVAGWWVSGGYWGELGEWQSGFMLCPVNVNASTDASDGLSLRVRIPAVRLSLEAFPLPPVVWFTVTQSYNSTSIGPFYMSDVNSPLPACVYIPGLNSSLEVHIWEFSSFFGSTGLHLYAEFRTNGSENLRFVADISYVSFLGVYATPAAVLRLAGGLAFFALCISLGCAYRGYFSLKRIAKNPLLLSIGFLFASMLVPWGSETIHYQSDGPPGVVSGSLLWGYVTLQSTDGGPQFLGVGFLSGTAWFVLLFWIPLFALGTRLAIPKRSSLDWLVVLLLMVPLLLPSSSIGIWGHYVVFWSLSNFGPGFLLSAAAPAVYLIGEGLLRVIPHENWMDTTQRE